MESFFTRFKNVLVLVAILLAQTIGLAIQVRRPALELGPEVPRHWYAGEPFATHYLDALSSVFPDGEAFFVRSVQRFRDQIDDPELKRSFLGRVEPCARALALYAEWDAGGGRVAV